MAKLLLSGETMSQWDIDSILGVESKDDAITRIIDTEWFEIHATRGDLTRGEIKELNDLIDY